MRLFLILLFFPLTGLTQTLQSHCIALAENTPGIRFIDFAAFGEGLTPEDVRLSYIGHSTYLIETPSGLGIATDYTGFIGGDKLPDVVTMNRAHSSHWTASPDPEIPHILRGWGDYGEPADHRLVLEDDILIRNVTTDIRGGGGVVEDGNSIFIFEIAGLCIGHLGHLHHEPSEAQYAAIGRLDVVMAPVDGGMTLPLPDMIKVLKRAKSSVVLPMHWFGEYTLKQFLVGMEDEFQVEVTGASSTTVSLRTLPRQPTIRVLLPRPFAPAD